MFHNTDRTTDNKTIPLSVFRSSFVLLTHGPLIQEQVNLRIFGSSGYCQSRLGKQTELHTEVLYQTWLVVRRSVVGQIGPNQEKATPAVIYLILVVEMDLSSLHKYSGKQIRLFVNDLDIGLYHTQYAKLQGEGFHEIKMFILFNAASCLVQDLRVFVKVIIFYCSQCQGLTY